MKGRRLFALPPGLSRCGEGARPQAREGFAAVGCCGVLRVGGRVGQRRGGARGSVDTGENRDLPKAGTTNGSRLPEMTEPLSF